MSIGRLNSYRCFRGTCSLHSEVLSSPLLALPIGTVSYVRKHEPPSKVKFVEKI